MKTRIIQTRFWEDEYVGDLSMEATLVFMYLLTTPSIGFTGVYECPDRKICFDTKVSAEKLKSVKEELAPRVIFMEGWVAIINAFKYNNYSKSKKLKKPVAKEWSRVPESMKKILVSKKDDTGSIQVLNRKEKYINTKTKKNSEEGLGGDAPDFVEAVVEIPDGYEKPPELPPPSPEIAEGLALFKAVNPGYRRFLKDLDQREALQELYDERGKVEVDEIIKILPKSNEVKFIPKAYSPIELREKYQKIITQIKIHLSEKEKIKSRVAF